MSLSSIIDCAIVLTLKTKVDRHAAIVHHLKEDVKIENVHLYTADGCRIRQRNDGGAGEDKKEIHLLDILCHNIVDVVSNDIFHNHINMIRWAYEKGYERVLFMEDDARFESFESDVIDRVHDWMDNNQWDIFYLGYCPWPIVAAFPIAINIIRIPSPYLAHAYILNRSGMAKILEHPSDQEIHIDKYLATLPNLIKMGVYPSICFQETDPALYDEAKKKIYIPLTFKTLSKTLEMIAVLWPILCILLLCFYLVLRYKKRGRSHSVPRDRQENIVGTMTDK